ncbi:MAG: transketolase [Elusimicrobia bacterium]|nr:transketolase [Elusimicrobiota bacterium]
MKTLEKTQLLSACSRWLRVQCVKAITEAGSGHPSTCLSAADLVAGIFFETFRFDPSDPRNPANDRIIFSKGHAAPLLYAAWSLAGQLAAQKLLTLRKFNSELEGHPTPRWPLAEVATGSLGQGLSIGLGMALSAKYLDQSPAKIYVLLGDGETAEGAVWEAASMASYYKTDNLIAVVDVNGLGQSQKTMLHFDTETYARRFNAFGWQPLVIDGHDMNQIVQALEKSQNPEGRPWAIIAKTFKGKGVSFIENKDGWHGKPLKKGAELESALQELSPASPDDEIAPPQAVKKPLPWQPPLNTSIVAGAPAAHKRGDQIATREAYGAALAKLGGANPNIVALDGDTKNSTFSEVFMKNYPGRFFEGFIAEQNIVGAAIGLAARGKIPFVSTFGAFFSRAYDQIRMGAISQANIKLVGSHCGVSIGEDGPSQMALEDLAMMRAIPGSTVLYPCDAVATGRLVEEASQTPGVVYIRTTRPKTPVLYEAQENFPVGGCKVLARSDHDRLTVVAAGITVHEALKAAALLAAEKIGLCVIDAYSVKPLDVKTITETARQTGNRVLVVEDHYPEGGLGDAVAGALAPLGLRVDQLAVRQLPRSGAPDELLNAYGINSRAIVQFVRTL